MRQPPGRQIIMVGFLQAQNCTNVVSSWRHPESTPGLHLARLLPRDRPHPGSWQIPSRLLRRPAGHARPLRQRPRAHRAVRHPLREARPGRRADDHGHGDRAAGPRRHLLHHLLPAVPCRAAVPDRRSDDARTRRVERGDLDERGRGLEHGPRRCGRARHPLRPRRRVHGSRAGALGFVGGRCHRRRPRHRACSRIPARCIASITPGRISARAGRSPCRARRRAIR